MDLLVLLMFLIIMAINWMLIYSKTQFNPNDTNRKYINIKNRSLAKLLIQQKSDYVKYVKVKDRLKLNIPCFIGYIIFAFIIIIAIIMYLIPEMPCEPTRLPFSKFNSIIIDTYNAKIPYILAFIMVFVQLDIMLVAANIKMFKTEKENTTKALKIGFSILTSVFFIHSISYICFNKINWNLTGSSSYEKMSLDFVFMFGCFFNFLFQHQNCRI